MHFTSARLTLVSWFFIHLGTVTALFVLGVSCSSETTAPSPAQKTSPQPATESQPDETVTKKSSSATPKASTLQFISEKIQINVLPSGKEVAIGGRYVFYNPLPKRWFSRLYFPFHINKNHPRPTTIRTKPKKYRPHKDGIALGIRIGPRKQKEITIAYKQAAPEQTATHLVSSAMGFGNKLKSARIDFILPVQYQLEESSYPLKMYKKNKAYHYYRYEKTDFIPNTDFTVSWD